MRPIAGGPVYSCCPGPRAWCSNTMQGNAVPWRGEALVPASHIFRPANSFRCCSPSPASVPQWLWEMAAPDVVCFVHVSCHPLCLCLQGSATYNVRRGVMKQDWVCVARVQLRLAIRSLHVYHTRCVQCATRVVQDPSTGQLQTRCSLRSGQSARQVVVSITRATHRRCSIGA
jgi:hypothetical protein